MKALVISHNVFCKTSSMGKTLKSYFKNWDENDIAQFYIHSEIPTDAICKNYYRITDKDAIKSILTRKSGTIFKEEDIRLDAITSRIDTGRDTKIYNKAKNKTPMFYIARNTWWNLSKWKSKKLLSWVDEFNPDIIFFSAGDCAFMYKIALFLAKYKNIPLVVSCMDDYYFHNKNENKLLGKMVHRSFMKQVKRTMDYATCIFPICEKMGKDYGKLFNKPYHTLPTPSTLNKPLDEEKTNAISYIGNLGYKRNEQIIKLGQALLKVQSDKRPQYIDVYSAESRPEILKDLNEENGIKFHGAISADEVLKVMGKSLAVIHTESFDKETRKSVAYSVSTKIADSLASGTPILAYGPGEVASIEYLLENNAAFCVTSDSELEASLCELIENQEKREEIVKCALDLAKRNHDSEKNCQMIRDVLEEIIKK